MAKVLVTAVLAASLVAPPLQASSAERPREPDPVASPSTVFPYVAGGRVDATTITFHPTAHPVLDVFDADGVRIFTTPIPNRRYVWNPRIGGDVLGTELTGAAGRVFRVCVTRRGEGPFGRAQCVKVQVAHVLEDRVVTRQRAGREYADATVRTGCSVRRGDVAVWLRCSAGGTATLRYDLPRPVLTDEQQLLGPAAFEWKGRYFRWGDGLSLTRTVRGAVVTAGGGFLGKLKWLKKLWTVRTEF